MSDLINKDGKTILQIDTTMSSTLNVESINVWLKNRIFNTIEVRGISEYRLYISGPSIPMLTVFISDTIGIYSGYAVDGTKKKTITTINPISKFNIGSHIFCHYDMEDLVKEVLRRKELEESRVANEKVNLEETKLNVLFVAGELALIGFPVDNVKFKDQNTVIDIEIPVDRKSTVTKNYIRLNVKKTKKKIKDISDSTKLDISFVKETTNRKDKIVTFDNITFLDSKVILRSFKDVYFKDDLNA